MPTNPTTSHKKGKAHYKKKKYSYSAVRAHVTDVMKFDTEKGADDALKAIQNHTKQLVKDYVHDIKFERDIEEDEEEARILEAERDKWHTVLDCVTKARKAIAELDECVGMEAAGEDDADDDAE
jgi:hypothetical protein